MCSNGEHIHTAKKVMPILKYITDQYASMQGICFVNTQGTSATDTQVTLLATRIKLSTVVRSTAGAKSKKATRKVLWDSAGDSDIEHLLYVYNHEASEKIN